MAWWSHCVKELKISPSEAWQLDYVECATLAEVDHERKPDASTMVNAQRRMNGMNNADIKNGGGLNGN